MQDFLHFSDDGLGLLRVIDGVELFEEGLVLGNERGVELLEILIGNVVHKDGAMLVAFELFFEPLGELAGTTDFIGDGCAR